MPEISGSLNHLQELHNCRICPRECGADRFSARLGWCNAGAGFNISSICAHRGEEPAISGKHGICNIFFSSCNLACIYCQNWQISSRKKPAAGDGMEFREVIDRIINLLDGGCHAVGFVSPSHHVPQVKAIIEAVRESGRNPVFVYNSNGYDKAETLKSLETYIDVYLPDFKYMDASMAKEYSEAADYPEIAVAALKEMYRQKGSVLLYDNDGCAEKGIVIRHLILPGHTENSIAVLRKIAGDISSSLTISLMAQYWPVPQVANHRQLGRPITPEEYERVTSELQALGFYKGWIQELDSQSNYLPDFDEEHPFEKAVGEGDPDDQ